MRIAVVEGPGLEPMPEYSAADVIRALADSGQEVTRIDLEGLQTFTRAEVDLLILPYLNGEIPEQALCNMVQVHEQGGGLLVLGQLPHRDRWAPTRNFHAFRFHLTAYCGPGQVDGLSDEGRELLGNLPDLERFKGLRFGCGRTTAFPPDETLPLFVSEDPQMQWESTPGVWIERKGRRFLGARFAQIACMGGEPRERAAGGYPIEWTHHPGLLTRDWPGMDLIVQRLVSAMVPRSWACALEFPPLHAVGDLFSPMLILRNLTGEMLTSSPLEVEIDGRRHPLPEQTLVPGKDLEIPLEAGAAPPGLRVWKVWQGDECLHRVVERILPDKRQKSSGLGFGFSTYWAFQHPKVPEEFITFCREMKQRGCAYVRVNLPWEDLEPEPGNYDWRIPDAYVRIADRLNLKLLFWLFPITRGATIGDGGVPDWVLKEPAMTYDGQPGFFPSLWSPWYRSHYFGMIDSLSRRYADTACLNRFIVDFGNSDFAYGYFYYVNDLTLFDYSEHERRAFADFLVHNRSLSREQVDDLYGEPLERKGEIPLPLADRHPEAWRVYLDFRAWSIREGLQEVERILRRNAPDKVAPDLPGHGAGSIADLSSYQLTSKADHWAEESDIPRELTGLHNAGPTWGGEAWQVGARYQEYDDALFQSLRLGSHYFTIPGPDIGVYGEDLCKVGHIRRWIEGAERTRPEIAILDHCGWDSFQSLAQVGARMDQPVDLISNRHRYDLSCYRLLVLTPNEQGGRMGTGGGGGHLLPRDRTWSKQLRAAVEKGLQIVLFPETAGIDPAAAPHPWLRQELGLTDVRYGPRTHHTIQCPASFGGGRVSGMAREIVSSGEAIVLSEGKEPLLVRRPLGNGTVWLAGYDNQPDSFDGVLSPYRTLSVAGHTLCRLATHLGIDPPRILSQQAYLYKEWLQHSHGEYLLLFSHLSEPLQFDIRLKLDQPADSLVDLATGERFTLVAGEAGWQHLHVCCPPSTGRYLASVR